MTSIVDYCKCRRCFRRTPRVHLRNGLCKGCRRELKLPVLEDKNMNIEIEEKLIKRLRNAFSENGLDIPETDGEWASTINSLLSEKITDDYGDNP